MSDEIKQRIWDYEVLGVLGSGGMGRVYKVRNVISDRVEAMKILLPNLAGRQELADRFLNEIKLLASLDHPNIAALRTALTVDNQLLMIMEYVEGITLAARLEHGPIPVGETLDYINQVLAALSYAHARGVIHRDIKPGNMMLTPGGVVKLMDFGIARSGTDGGMTKTGTTLGSVHYMSPEQVRCEPIDARSDLYSLGITLYELVTGQRPFQADSEFSLMAAQVKEIPKPPMQLQSGLPAGLNEIILMAIEKDPAKRFQSAEAFRNALSNITYDSSGVTATIDVKQPGIAPAVAAKATPTAVPPQVAGMPAGPRGTSAGAPRAATGVGAAAAEASAAASAVAADVPLRKNDHHVLYITLGAVLALAALVGAGTYVSARRGRAKEGGSMLGGKSTPSPSATPDAAPAATQTPDASSTQAPAAAPSAQPAAGDGGTAPADASGGGNTAPSAAPAETKSAGGTSPAASHSGGRNSGMSKGAASQAEQKAANDQAAAAAAADAAAAAAAEKEKFDQLEMSIDQLQSRIDAANNTLEGIEQEQSRSGLRMRSDITAARSAMLNGLKKAQDAVADHDAEKAQRYSKLAEANLEIIERFLGR
ncbi:MAG: serine/threonine protein kinase [Candidatus Acidiferrales bacterium]